MRIADISDLNAPYALPRAGRVAILAGDPALAQVALDRLAALGTRGRAVDADRSTIRAGLAAMAGDEDAARAGYRTALASYRDLGLAWDEALVGQEAASMLGAGDPEIAGWVETARGTFGRLGAAPMLVLLEQAVAGAGAPEAPGRTRAATREMSDEAATAGG